MIRDLFVGSLSFCKMAYSGTVYRPPQIEIPTKSKRIRKFLGLLKKSLTVIKTSGGGLRLTDTKYRSVIKADRAKALRGTYFAEITPLRSLVQPYEPMPIPTEKTIINKVTTFALPPSKVLL